MPAAAYDLRCGSAYVCLILDTNQLLPAGVIATPFMLPIHVTSQGPALTQITKGCQSPSTAYTSSSVASSALSMALGKIILLLPVASAL